jgi:hypothetical protein
MVLGLLILVKGGPDQGLPQQHLVVSDQITKGGTQRLNQGLIQQHTSLSLIRLQKISTAPKSLASALLRALLAHMLHIATDARC